MKVSYKKEIILKTITIILAIGVVFAWHYYEASRISKEMQLPVMKVMMEMM
ncbi:MAG: hypothetical protein ACRC23_01955 [Aeromonas jandaei]